jgi:predicted transcriptional regulator
MYLALCEHHRTLIELGIGDADAGRVVSHQSLKDMSKLWGPR